MGDTRSEGGTVMCLYIDYDDHDTLLRAWDKPTHARKEHVCIECRRIIAPGEMYHRWAWLDRCCSGWSAAEMCLHCRTSIRIAARASGCPEQWNWEYVWDWDESLGLIADALDHALPRPDAIRLRSLRVYARRKWLGADGALVPVPVAS